METTHYTCPVCKRQVKADSRYGTLARHGFKRKWGQTGIGCPGWSTRVRDLIQNNTTKSSVSATKSSDSVWTKSYEPFKGWTFTKGVYLIKQEQTGPIYPHDCMFIAYQSGQRICTSPDLCEAQSACK